MRNLLFLLMIIPAIGCTSGSATPSATPPAPAKIVLVKPERKVIQRVIEQPGSVQAFEEASLVAKIPGYIARLADDPAKATSPPHDRAIDLGSRVTKDQLLLEITVPELAFELEQKQAGVKQTLAEIVQAKKAESAAVAVVESAKAQVAETRAALNRAQAVHDRWQTEADRAVRMVKEGVVDAQTRDETQNQFKAAQAARAEAAAKVVSAEAAITKAEAERDKAAADVLVMEQRHEVAKAEVKRLEALMNYTRIRAPFDGIVTHRKANVGDFVNSNGSHTLFRVSRIDPVRVVVQVPEQDAALVVAGQEVGIALPNGLRNGKIARTSWSLEPGSRTLRTELDVPNSDGALRPGMYATAKMNITLPAEWSLPAAAIAKVNDEPVVYLVENGKALRVPVRLFKADATTIQIKAYKRGTEWVVWTGNESIATPAASIVDGQSVP